jgi:hypothetical protein
LSTRRTVLRAGAGALIVGTGAGVWRAWDQGVFRSGEGPAFEAWNTWDDAAPGSPLRLVHAAILAASPHNTQPWRFRIGTAGIDLFADPARNIGGIDPFRREMQMGLGCALENLLQAAAATGFTARTAMFPDAADPTHIAAMSLTPSAPVASPLYAAIAHRHTNRGPYDTHRVVPGAVLEELERLGADLADISVRWFVGTQVMAGMAAAIVAAAEAIVADADQSRDSGAWFRNAWSEIQTCGSRTQPGAHAALHDRVAGTRRRSVVARPDAVPARLSDGGRLAQSAAGRRRRPGPAVMGRFRS